MDYRNIGRWFGILDRQSQNYINSICTEKNLNYHEYILLLNLYENEGIYQEDMASVMMVDKSVVTRSLNTLEKKGFVERRQHATDKRIKQIYSTELSRAQQVFITGLLNRWIDFISEGLPPDKIAVIMECLQHLAERAIAFEEKRKQNIQE